MNLGGRVIKTVIAVIIAVFISQVLGLEGIYLAGVVAIISVQRSFYYSIKQAAGKIGSVVLGTLVGGVFGYYFGQNSLTVGAAVFVTIQLALLFHMEEHIVMINITALPLIFHPMGGFWFSMGNQLAVAMIGAVTGLSLNFLFSPYHKKEVESFLLAAEEELRQLLYVVLQIMREPEKHDRDIINRRLVLLRENIEAGRRLANLLHEEQLYHFVEDTPSERYIKAFKIFEAQTNRIEDLHKLARRISWDLPQIDTIIKIGGIIARIQKRALKGLPYPRSLFEKSLEKKENIFFADRPFPLTQDAFITRAALLHILTILRNYYHALHNLPSF